MQHKDAASCALNGGVNGAYRFCSADPAHLMVEGACLPGIIFSLLLPL